MQIDEYLDLSHLQGGEKHYEMSMAVMQLYSKFDSIQMLPAGISLNFRGDQAIICNRDGNISVTAHIHKNLLEPVFKAYGKKMPRALLRLMKYTEYFLFDMESISTNTLRFYIPDDHLDYSISNAFPFDSAIPEMDNHDYRNLQLIGFFIDCRNDEVTQYKYYMGLHHAEVHNYRFDGRTKQFMSRHVEIATLLTPEEVLDDPIFGHLFTENTLELIHVIASERQDVNQRYLSVCAKSAFPDDIDLSQREHVETPAVPVEEVEETANNVIDEE